MNFQKDGVHEEQEEPLKAQLNTQLQSSQRSAHYDFQNIH